MKYVARRHPFLFGLAVLIFSPYLLALALACALVMGAAAALDAMTEG